MSKTIPTGGKLIKQSIDVYEQQLLWVRIFENICNVDTQNEVPNSIHQLKNEAWAIYNSITLGSDMTKNSLKGEK